MPQRIGLASQDHVRRQLLLHPAEVVCAEIGKRPHLHFGRKTGIIQGVEFERVFALKFCSGKT